MKRTKLLSLMAALFLSFSPCFAQAEIELNFQSYFSQAHAVTKQFTLEWIDEVTKASNNQVIIHHLGPGAVVNVNEMAAGVRNGIVDIVFTTPTAEDFPYLQPLNGVYISDSAVHSGKIFWKAYETMPEIKKNVDNYGVPLVVFGQAASGFYSTKEAIRTPADLKGKRVIVGSSIDAEVMKAVGATPVFVSFTDIYIALQKGMGDILYTGVLSAESFKIQEIAKYATLMCTHRVLILMLLNNDVAKEMKPEELQALKDVCSKMAEQPGSVMDGAADKAFNTFKEAGAELITLSPEVEEQFAKMIIPHMDAYWTSRMEANGVADPKKVMEQFRTIADTVK